MPGEREEPEEIVSKLRQVQVQQGQGATISEAVRQIGVTQQAFYRWRKFFAGTLRAPCCFSVEQPRAATPLSPPSAGTMPMRWVRSQETS